MAETKDSTPKHTPGPWRAGEGGDGHLRVYNKRGTVICQFGYGQDEEATTLRNADANARLIAAAPDLLAALERVAENAEGHAEWFADNDRPHLARSLRHQVVDVARAAIAKAKGA